VEAFVNIWPCATCTFVTLFSAWMSCYTYPPALGLYKGKAFVLGVLHIAAHAYLLDQICITILLPLMFVQPYVVLEGFTRRTNVLEN
jgi:hypothetical protein